MPSFVCPFAFLGGLGAVRRRLRRVVPPGVRGRVLRNGWEWRLHLCGLFPEGRRSEWRRRRRGGDRGGGGGGERRCAGDVDVCRPAESTIDARHGLLVPRTLRLSSKPSNFTSAAAARASAGQLAQKNGLGLHLNTVSHTKPSIQLAFQPVRLYSICGTEWPFMSGLGRRTNRWHLCNCLDWRAQEKKKGHHASGRQRRVLLSPLQPWHALSLSLSLRVKICQKMLLVHRWDLVLLQQF